MYKIRVIPAGTILYKGVRFDPRGVLHSSKVFYVTEDLNIAKKYGDSVIAYKTKVDLNLFVINDDNIKKMYDFLFSLEDKAAQKLVLDLMIITGVGVTPSQQRMYFKNVPNSVMAGRVSHMNADRDVFSRMCKMFLKYALLDGYYAPRTFAPAHGGHFHAEMMLCSATKNLTRYSYLKNSKEHAYNIPDVLSWDKVKTILKHMSFPGTAGPFKVVFDAFGLHFTTTMSPAPLKEYVVPYVNLFIHNFTQTMHDKYGSDIVVDVVDEMYHESGHRFKCKLVIRGFKKLFSVFVRVVPTHNMNRNRKEMLEYRRFRRKKITNDMLNTVNNRFKSRLYGE